MVYEVIATRRIGGDARREKQSRHFAISLADELFPNSDCVVSTDDLPFTNFFLAFPCKTIDFQRNTHTNVLCSQAVTWLVDRWWWLLKIDLLSTFTAGHRASSELDNGGQTIELKWSQENERKHQRCDKAKRKRTKENAGNSPLAAAGLLDRKGIMSCHFSTSSM